MISYKKRRNSKEKIIIIKPQKELVIIKTASKNDGIIQIKDIPYTGNSEPEAPKMDGYLPENKKEKIPACILIHGGGWTTGDKADEREQNMAKTLCELGYAVFSINYHMAKYEDGPYHGKRTCCAWPGCIADCMDAISYVRANAERFSVRPDKIAVIGSSAGGHLALLIAAAAEHPALQKYRRYTEIPCNVSCAMSLYGVPDIMSWGGGLLMPEPYEASKEEWRLASPGNHLEKEPAPILLIHGDSDQTVDVAESLRCYELLTQKKYRAQLIVVKGGKHSFDYSALSPEQFQKMKGFLTTYLGEENET